MTCNNCKGTQKNYFYGVVDANGEFYSETFHSSDTSSSRVGVILFDGSSDANSYAQLVSKEKNVEYRAEKFLVLKTRIED